MKSSVFLSATIILLVFTVRAGDLPATIKNQCEMSWHNGFVQGTINVSIDLKNSKGDLEENSYIYLECSGEFPKLDKPPYIDTSKPGTKCTGIRIMGRKKDHLSRHNIFTIWPNDIKVVSKPGQDPIELEWEEASIFKIKSGKTVSWSMKSKLSGNTHNGHTICTEN